MAATNPAVTAMCVDLLQKTDEAYLAANVAKFAQTIKGAQLAGEKHLILSALRKACEMRATALLPLFEAGATVTIKEWLVDARKKKAEPLILDCLLTLEIAPYTFKILNESKIGPLVKKLAKDEMSKVAQAAARLEEHILAFALQITKSGDTNLIATAAPKVAAPPPPAPAPAPPASAPAKPPPPPPPPATAKRPRSPPKALPTVVISQTPSSDSVTSTISFTASANGPAAKRRPSDDNISPVKETVMFSDGLVSALAAATVPKPAAKATAIFNPNRPGAAAAAAATGVPRVPATAKPPRPTEKRQVAVLETGNMAERLAARKRAATGGKKGEAADGEASGTPTTPTGPGLGGEEDVAASGEPRVAAPPAVVVEKRRKKKVSFASDDKLCQVKTYELSMEEKMEKLNAFKEIENPQDPRTEEKEARQKLKRIIEMVPWVVPPPYLLPPAIKPPQVVSTERETQERRVRTIIRIFYTDENLPPTPNEPENVMDTTVDPRLVPKKIPVVDEIAQGILPGGPGLISSLVGGIDFNSLAGILKEAESVRLPMMMPPPLPPGMGLGGPAYYPPPPPHHGPYFGPPPPISSLGYPPSGYPPPSGSQALPPPPLSQYAPPLQYAHPQPLGAPPPPPPSTVAPAQIVPPYGTAAVPPLPPSFYPPPATSAPAAAPAYPILAPPAPPQPKPPTISHISPPPLPPPVTPGVPPAPPPDLGGERSAEGREAEVEGRAQPRERERDWDRDRDRDRDREWGDRDRDRDRDRERRDWERPDRDRERDRERGPRSPPPASAQGPLFNERCRFYGKPGGCRRGDDCNFLHLKD